VWLKAGLEFSMEGGELGDRAEHAEVPGSSEPSGQSQKSSLTCEASRVMDGLKMQVKNVGSL
jgi:hypothetical protein